MHGDWRGLQVCLCYLQARCEPIVLQDQHRSAHGDAVVSSPASSMSSFKPLWLFCCLNCGRVELIVENKHGEWMFMQGLFWFFSNCEVIFQSYYVKFTPVLRVFLSNDFDCCSPVCPAVRRGNYNIYVSHPGSQIQEICLLVPVSGEMLLWGRCTQPSSPPCRLNHRLLSRVGNKSG